MRDRREQVIRAVLSAAGERVISFFFEKKKRKQTCEVLCGTGGRRKKFQVYWTFLCGKQGGKREKRPLFNREDPSALPRGEVGTLEGGLSESFEMKGLTSKIGVDGRVERGSSFVHAGQELFSRVLPLLLERHTVS